MLVGFMFYGFFRWFNLNRDSLQRGLLKEFKCVIKETYTLLEHNIKDEKLERHIRLDQAGLLHNSNTPEAHITFIDNILKVRINFSTTGLETAVFASIRDHVSVVRDIAKKNQMIAKVQREVEILKSLIGLYQQAKKQGADSLNSLQYSLEDISKKFFSTDLTLKQKEALLEDYKSSFAEFKAKEDALNDIRDQFEQSNSSQLIAVILNKLEKMIKGEKTASQQQPELIEPEKVDSDIVEALGSSVSQSLEQDQKNSSLVSTVIQEITIDNFDEALQQQTNPPEDMSALEFLNLLSRIREFSRSFEPLANSGSSSPTIEQSHLYFLPTEAIKNELKSMFDAKSQADVDASFLQLKYWQPAPHFKKVVQDFCSTYKSTYKLESDDTLMISPLQYFAMKNEVEIFQFLLLSGVSANSAGIYSRSGSVIDLQYSLLLEISASEEIYMVFLEFFEGALSQSSQERLQQLLEIVRINRKIRGANMEVKLLENTSILEHPLIMAVRRDFHIAIPVILSKTASLVNVFIGFARFIEKNARISMATTTYLEDNIVFIEDDHFQEVFSDFASFLIHMEANNSELLKGKKGALNFIRFPKMMFRFHDVQSKSKSVISHFYNHLSKVKDLTYERFASEVLGLIRASSVESDKYDALMMARASLYLCLVRLQQADLSVPLSFYRQLSALLIDCLVQVKSALTNCKPKRNFYKIAKNKRLQFFDKYLRDLQRFAADNKVNFPTEVIVPLLDSQEIEAKAKNKPKKRRGRRR